MVAFKKAGLKGKEMRRKKQWLLEKPVEVGHPSTCCRSLKCGQAPYNFHRRSFFAGGWPEEVDVEVPEVGGVGGPWVVVTGGVSGMGHTIANFFWAVLANHVVKVHLPLVRQTIGEDERGQRA